MVVPRGYFLRFLMVSSSLSRLRSSYHHTLFLGHSGIHVSEYAAIHLPDLIHTALRSKVGQHESGKLKLESISKLLNSQIRKFDGEIGKALVKLCPKPEDIDDEVAQALFEGPDVPILRRAMAGTTFTGALIDGEKKHMWVVGLGDSSAGRQATKFAILR